MGTQVDSKDLPVLFAPHVFYLFILFTESNMYKLLTIWLFAGFLGMTERWKNLHGKSHNKWVMCPTCRQHTEYGNVAFVDDMHTKSPDASVSTFRSSEASVNVKGSYSTKVYI